MISGGIIMWSGAIVNIPSGYVLCNGSNGTPDLRDKFIVGSGTTYAVGGTGGSLTHSHTLLYAGVLAIGTGPQTTTDSKNHLPPYYSLAYIMKT